MNKEGSNVFILSEQRIFKPAINFEQVWQHQYAAKNYFITIISRKARQTNDRALEKLNKRESARAVLYTAFHGYQKKKL